MVKLAPQHQPQTSATTDRFWNSTVRTTMKLYKLKAYPGASSMRQKPGHRIRASTASGLFSRPIFEELSSGDELEPLRKDKHDIITSFGCSLK